MRNSILEIIGSDQIIVGDGAIGTMLQARGLPAGVMPELWNAEHPDIVQEVHRLYLEAGAQFATTNTFGGNRIRMGEAGLAERTAELTRLGAEAARAAVGDDAWVAGSVGPTGQLMAPYGTLSTAQAEDVFAEQIEALVEGGADLIKIETQHDVEEACCAVRMAKAHSPLPVICSFAFNGKGRTMMGLNAAEAAQRALEAGADVVGANCGDGPQAIRAALEQMRAVTSAPLLAQANAGIPSAGAHAETTWDVTPEQLAEYARTFVSLGARVVAGCCGTGPLHIAALARALRP